MHAFWPVIRDAPFGGNERRVPDAVEAGGRAGGASPPEKKSPEDPEKRLHPEIRFFYLIVVKKIVSGSGSRDPSALEDVCPV